MLKSIEENHKADHAWCCVEGISSFPRVLLVSPNSILMGKMSRKEGNVYSFPVKCITNAILRKKINSQTHSEENA